MSEYSKWHTRFMEMAKMVATWSKDPGTQVGSVLVKENRIISTGYNGIPHGIDDEFALTCRDFKIKNTIHSEINAIKYATADVRGSVLYCTQYPCSNCAKVIAESGIAVVYVLESSGEFKDRWDCVTSEAILKAAHVPIVVITLSPNHTGN